MTQDCIEWSGARNEKGYGRLKLRGEQCYAHRVAYEQAFGPIPEGLLVLHSCDNPPCINPEHLSVGTYADNHRDMIQKGRQGFKRTSPEIVEVMRRMRSAGALYQEIADRMGVALSTAWIYCNGNATLTQNNERNSK